MSVKTVTTSDLEARIQELEAKVMDDDELEEFQALTDLRHDLDYCWRQPATLIREADFVEYAMEFLYEVGDLKKGGVADSCIDQDEAARIVEQDYRLCVHDGEDYLVRA
jgi:hypothetical protein